MENREDEDTAIEAEQPIKRWFIDLDWFPRNNRSFLAITQDSLCPDCRQRLGTSPGDIAEANLLAAISGCCSKAPAFITSELPIRQSIFRLFLANGNQPLNLEQLSQELNEQRGGYPTPPVALLRLLKSDDFYGIYPTEA